VEIILRDNCHLSVPAISALHKWVAQRAGYVNAINKPAGSGKK